MKIQCSCGMKYAFDLTPEMSRAPITFVCKNCGVDSSAMVNQLIRQELGLAAPATASSPPASGSVPAFAPPPTTERVVVRVNTPGANPPSEGAAARPAPPQASGPT